MTKKALGRAAAVVAVTATVGGLLPFLAVTSASAAEPTALTVTPSAAYTTSGGSVTYTGTLTGASGTLDHGVYANIYSGPDAIAATPLLGTACNVAGVMYTCTVKNTTGNPGMDNIRFFYDAAGTAAAAGTTASYQSSDPSATGSLTVGGAINAVTLTPISNHAGQTQYQAYTVSATDAQGRPVSGGSLTVTVKQDNTTNADLTATGTKPAPGAVFGIPTAPTPNVNGVTPTGTAAGTVTTSDGSGTVNNTSAAGSGIVYIASKVAGSVSITVTPTAGTTSVSTTGSLTVGAAGINDATSVAITPATQKAFTSTTTPATTNRVTETVTVTNAQGDPIAGVTPIFTITNGPNAGAPITATGPTDGTGTTTASYFPGATAGTDTVQAFINQTDHVNNTGGLDAGEPSGTASVVIAAEHVKAITGGTITNVPADATSSPVTFTLTTDDNSSPAGYNVNFSVAGTPATVGKYTLSQASGVTDANGNVTVTVLNANPAAGDSAVVTATLVGDATKTGSDTVNWQARTAGQRGVVIAPFANTAPTGGSTTHTVTATDQFGAPIAGVTYTWVVMGRNNANNNAGATGTGATFTYTDAGLATSGGTDTVTVTASTSTTSAAGVVTTTQVGTDSVKQYWVVGTATAAQANIDLSPFTGMYTANGTNGPLLPTGFTKSATAAVTSDPTTTTPSTPTAVEVKLVDANGNKLFGKSVTFTSTGVGGFTDVNGKPIGNTTTALVTDNSGANGEADVNPTSGVATVYVRSTQSGTETIKATVDGISDSATVNYTGQYVPVAPTRVLDSRNGQGGLTSFNGGTPVAGRLAPNTVYYFSYGSTDMPLNAASYAFNVTAISPNGLGNLRIESGCANGNPTLNGGAPQTSLINYQLGKDSANFAVVPNPGLPVVAPAVSVPCNILKIYSANSSAAVAIDLVGYYPTTAGITEITPTRVVDTRTGLGGGTGRIKGNTSRSFQILGAPGTGTNTGAKAVALNVTAIDPSDLGNLRVYPDGGAVPTASNVNYIPGIDKAAFVIVNLPANGKIDVYSAGGTVDVAIDAFAFYPANSNLVTQAPVRILDTRNGGTLQTATAQSIKVAGLAGVPADAQAVLVSVTGIHTKGSTGVGNLRVYPTGGEVPTVSTLNYVSANTDVANFAIVKLGTGGQLSLYSAGAPIDVAVDVVGYIPAGNSTVN